MGAKGSAYLKLMVAMGIVGSFVALNKVASAAMPIFLFSETICVSWFLLGEQILWYTISASPVY